MKKPFKSAKDVRPSVPAIVMLKQYLSGKTPALPLESVLHEERGWPKDTLPEFT